MNHVRMDWEVIAFMLGDIHTLYRESQCYAERHTYTAQQRRLLLTLGDCIESWKEETECEIGILLMEGETNE